MNGNPFFLVAKTIIEASTQKYKIFLKKFFSRLKNQVLGG